MTIGAYYYLLIVMTVQKVNGHMRDDFLINYFVYKKVTSLVAFFCDDAGKSVIPVYDRIWEWKNCFTAQV